jgi:hypothetical protein
MDPGFHWADDNAGMTVSSFSNPKLEPEALGDS